MVRVAVKLILIFILVFTGVKVWYNRLEESLLSVPEPAVASIEPQVEEQTEILRKTPDYKIITDRNIFQAVLIKVEKKEEVVVEEVLAPTKLKLSLMGTVSGSDRNARAIISDDKSNKQDIYLVGDAIQGAFIKSIERGKVILEVNGRDEVLELVERKGGGPAYVPSPSDFYQEPKEEQVKASKAKRKPVVRPRPQNRQVKGSKKQRDENEEPGLDELPLSEQDITPGGEETYE